MLSIGRTDNKYITVNLTFYCLLIAASAFGESLSDLLSFQMNVNYSFLLLLVCVAGVFAGYLKSRQDNAILFWCMVVVLCLLGTIFVDLLALDFDVPLGVVVFIILCLFVAVYGLLFLTKKKFLQLDRETRLNFLFWFEVFILIALGTALGDFIAEKIYNAFFLSAVLFAELLAGVLVIHKQFRFNKVFCLAAALIVSRSLGVTLSDAIAFPTEDGGAGLGFVASALIFFIIFILLMVYYFRTIKSDGAK
jgi:uncharacterized membrane-anchored protein